MSQAEDDPSFFEKERDKISNEITSGFEELLLSSNVLNRKLEEVLAMSREYETIAVLWKSFHELMRRQSPGDNEEQQGLPGTGGHILAKQDSS